MDAVRDGEIGATGAGGMVESEGIGGTVDGGETDDGGFGLEKLPETAAGASFSVGSTGMVDMRGGFELGGSDQSGGGGCQSPAVGEAGDKPDDGVFFEFEAGAGMSEV